MKKFRIVLILVLFFLVLSPLYAQDDTNNRIWVGIPLYLSYQLDVDNLGQYANGNIEVTDVSSIIQATGDVPGIVINELSRIDANLAVQVFFPIPGSPIAIGPEVGLSMPLTALAWNAVIAHIPLRAVMNIALGGVGLDVVLGTEFNILDTLGSTEVDASSMTFDLGVRLDLGGFLIDAVYTLPFSVNLAAPGATDANIPSDFWENSLSIGLGGRIRI